MANASTRSLAALRQSLALAGLARELSPVERVAFESPSLDEPLGGGIARAALHEVYASAGADLPAATGFAAALALRAAGSRPVLWVRQDFLDAEAGRLHPPGLAELGLDPAQVLLVRVRDGEGALRAGAEAARCAALGATLIEPWGAPRQFDLTASRRAPLAAETSGVLTLLLRVAAEPEPSAASTRWQVRALPSRAQEAQAPGDPAFGLRLLRHRGGLGEREWRVEWDRDERCFRDRIGSEEAEGMQRRYLALWFPYLASERLRRRGSAGPDERPLVLVEKDRGALRLADCDKQAVKLGLTRGLTLADARARIPELAVVEADPAADQRLIEWLAALCDRFTPLVALDPPHGLVLDITGCAHLFGGEAALRQRLGHGMHRLGLTLLASIAGTPQAHRALSRFGRCAISLPGEDEQRTLPLPVSALEASSDTVIALSRAGLKTLGDLAGRPSHTLAARFGEALVTKLRRILGHEDARITPLRPPPDCVVERHFPDPLQDTDGLEAIVTRLLGEAGRLLETRGEGGRAFEISFFRSDGAVRRLSLETGRPSRDAGAILRLYRERIDSLADPLDPGFGYDAIRLAVPVCEPLGTPQASLDGRAVEEEAVADLVDRLVARFGRERVLRFVAQDSHQPEREAALVPAAAGKVEETPWPASQPDEPPARPLQLFEPPQPVETLAEVPDGPPLRFRWRRVLHEIARAEGPERIAPDWWRDGPGEHTRDYYRVEDAQGRRFWLFRAGLYGRETTAPRWYLHGLFA